MPISNITRTNTVDEWRIQTNLSANSLNKLETGNYDKTAGSLNIACTAVLSITSSGTGLSVANNALVSGDFTVGKSIALGSEGAATGNLTVGANVFIYGRGASLFVANSAIVNVSIQATQSIRTNNFIANTDASITGTAQIGQLTVNTSTAIGTTLAVTGNATVGNLVTSNSVVGDNGRFSSNVVASHFVTVAGSLVADSARITANATFGETTATTINATNARVSGNANVAHLTASGSLVADSARIAANATFSETTATTINATNARISGNANAAHMTIVGSVVADSARIASNATFGETTATTINATNARISGNANVSHLTATGSTVANSLRITNDAGIGGTLRVTGNSVFGNVNTANMLYAGSLGIIGRADIGTDFTVGGDASVGGKLTVTGDFVLSGDIVYDTDILSISTVTPVTTTGAGYYGVFRGNTSGGVTGHNGLANSDANAYIRWSASSNTWQIRDVFNPDVGTSYSKILTANLISNSLTSTSADTFLSSSGAKSLKDSIDTEISDRQANVGAARISLTNGYQANTGAARLELLANVGAARIADVASGQANVGAGLISTKAAYEANVGAGLIVTTNGYQANTGAARLELLANTGAGIILANTNLKNYTDSTFLKLSTPGITQTVTGDLAFNGNLTVTGTTTYLNTTELNVSDNEIVLNSDWPTNAVPTQNAGITIHRGVHSNIYVRYDEANDYWVLRDNVGQFIIATTANVGSAVIQGQANSGLGIITANTNMKNYVDTRTTTNISEGTNLYYTDARARAAVGVAATFGSPLNYISANGAFQHLNSGVTATNYGGAATVPVFTVNATGHLSYAGNVAIAISSSAVSGLAASATTNTTNADNISSGTLAVARGGTGLSSYTSSGVLYASGTGTLASGSNFVFDGTNVGIGASSPSTYGKFVVGGTGSFTSSFVSTSTTNTDKPTFEFRKTMDVGSGVTNTIGRLSFFGKLNSTIGEQAYLNVSSTNLSGVVDNNTLTMGVRALSVGVNSSYLELAGTGVTLQSGTQYGTITMNSSAISITHPTQEIVYDANYHDFYGSGVFNSNLRSVSLGVGTAASGTTGEIRATGEITAGYSDDNLKNRLGNIEDALAKVSAISGFYYEPNQTAQDLGYAVRKEVGVSAQEVQAILPEVVVPAPVDSRYLTVHYEKLIPLLIEAIKELKAEVEELKKK